MTVLKFGEYRPDMNALNNPAVSETICNAIPTSTGYRSMAALDTFSAAVGAQIRGAFYAVKSDKSVAIFAATATKIYQLNNTTFTWTDVSKGATTYSAINDGVNWGFAQFENTVIAVQQNTAPQKFNIDSDSAFSDLGGSPPNASYVAILNRFVVLAGIASNPKRVQWSALGDMEGWTAGTDYSDYQDLPDGGDIQGVVGGELGVLPQESAVRRLIYSPGSSVTFGIDVIARNVGCIAPSTVTHVKDRMFWLSRRGFVQIDQAGGVQYIGQERVDRTYLGLYDDSAMELCQAASDPAHGLVGFTFRDASQSDDGTHWHGFFLYSWILDKWTKIDANGQFLTSVSLPGSTLENINLIGAATVSGAADNGAGLIRLTVDSTTGMTTNDYRTVQDVAGTTEANGDWLITVVDATHLDLQGSTFTNAYTTGGYVQGSVDALDFSLDSVEAARLPAFGAFSTAQKFGTYSGAPLEATLETADQNAMMRRRTFTSGFEPICDADTIYGSIGYRENLQSDVSYTTEQTVNSHGFIPGRRASRIQRYKLRIPAGTAWEYADGLEPVVSKQGRR